MSVARCSCDPVTKYVDEDCRVHGLPDGVRFPPMDRHAKGGEDARAGLLCLQVAEGAF